MKIKKWLGLTVLAATAIIGLTACSSSTQNSKDGTVTVKVGTMTLTDAEQTRWDKIQEILDKENAGVKLEFTQFTDYSQPNKALLEGEVDINAFQHHYFFDNWNKDNNADLVSVADTIISPIRLYSGTKDGKNKYSSIEDLPKNATIAIPNDATNESRALYLLQAAGLIKLDVKSNEFATISDVKENPKNLEFSELDASQTAASLTSVDAAVVNGNFVQEAKLDYKKALYTEKVNEDSKPWYNLIAAQKDWKKSDKADAIKKIVKAYHTDEVKKVTEKASDGLDLPVW